MKKKIVLSWLSRKCLFLIILVFGCSLTVFSQQVINVTGTVTDSTDAGPLPGVSISIIGSPRIAAVTNVNGKYSLAVPVNATLVFKYLGYKEKSILVVNQTVIDVALSTTASGLNEVVVVGFGTQKKATVTGAIASIQTKEIKQSPAANLAVTLAGRLPGLTTVQSSGEPGRDATSLYIRGQGTVNAQSPIVLVDGVERDLTYIDPNEIESVTILKDASSTAIFGVRGANGVILVTTRRGTSEIPEINVTTEGGAQDFPRFITPVDAFDFATLRNLARANDGLPAVYSAADLEHYRLGDDPLRYANTDWKAMNLKDFSLQQRYNLNISSAGKTAKYFVNAGYLNQGGQFKHEKGLNYDPSFKLDRYNFRSNIDLQLNKTLKAYLNVAGYLEKQNMPMSLLNKLSTDFDANLASQSAAQGIIGLMNDLNATAYGPLDPNGDVITLPTVDWPTFGLLNRSGYTQQTRSNVLATFGMEQNLDFITKGLSVKAAMSFDSRSTNNLFAGRDFAKRVQVVNPNLKGADGRDSVSYTPYNAHINTPLSIRGGHAFSSLSNFQGYINYNRAFNKHSVTGLVLYQQQKNIFDEQLPFNLMGVAGRLTYGFDNKYFAEFNAGYNGSEQFAKGRRFGFFPAVSAGWIISNENFLANNKTFTLLKLRGSYGEVGNDRIGSSRFLYLDNIQVGGGGYSGSLGNGSVINVGLLKNESLQWEVAKKANIGLELGLFDDLSLTVDLFHERRDNILRTRGTVPVLNGLPASVLPPVNIGVVENKGYEIELGYRKAVNSNFSFLSKLNLNYAINEQIFTDEAELPEDNAFRYRQRGFFIGQPFGYEVDRYFRDAADVANSPVQNVGGHASRPGDFKYKDLNGDNVVDVRDQAPIGFGNVPQYTFGAAFSVTLKNLDASALLQGAMNMGRYFSGRGSFATAGVKNYLERHKSSWTEERAANGEEILYPRLTTQTNPNEIPNSFFIVDASYIRLKNVEIGYTLPLGLSKKVGASRARIYANGLNLLTFDKMPTEEYDPEVLNWAAYPILRIYNVGLNVTF